jgi:hypothetical protein
MIRRSGHRPISEASDDEIVSPGLHHVRAVRRSGRPEKKAVQYFRLPGDRFQPARRGGRRSVSKIAV